VRHLIVCSIAVLLTACDDLRDAAREQWHAGTGLAVAICQARNAALARPELAIDIHHHCAKRHAADPSPGFARHVSISEGTFDCEKYPFEDTEYFSVTINNSSGSEEILFRSLITVNSGYTRTKEVRNLFDGDVEVWLAPGTQKKVRLHLKTKLLCSIPAIEPPEGNEIYMWTIKPVASIAVGIGGAR